MPNKINLNFNSLNLLLFFFQFKLWEFIFFLIPLGDFYSISMTTLLKKRKKHDSGVAEKKTFRNKKYFLNSFTTLGKSRKYSRSSLATQSQGPFRARLIPTAQTNKEMICWRKYLFILINLHALNVGKSKFSNQEFVDRSLYDSKRTLSIN